MANKTFNDVKINVKFDQATSDVVVSGGNNHASNIDGSTAQDLALALGKIQNWFTNWHSVVWTGDAATVNGHSVNIDIPKTAKFTDTTYTLSGAASSATYVITLTPSSGTPTTATVPAGSTSAYGLVKLSSATNSTSAALAATPSAVKAAYDLASGKSTVAFAQGLTSGTEVGTITINGTATKLYAPAADGNNKVTQTVITTNKNYPLLLSYYENTSTTSTAQTAQRANAIYANPSTGTITATNFVGTVNGYTIGKTVPSDAVFTDTKYTFTGGSSGAYFKVTPSGGSEQTVYISGLGTMAFENKTNYVATSKLGVANGVATLDGDGLIPSSQLPSYVDDVIEGYYYNNKFYKEAAHTNEITGETGKIYVDLSVSPAETYRWSGSAFASMKSPTIHAVADVVQKSNGIITKSYTDGTASADVTVYTHPTTAGNKHIPSGGSSGQFLGWSSSGTAVWKNIPTTPVYTGATASAAGVTGTVPAAAAGQNATHYLRGDGTWSNDPVIEADILTLNVIAGS